MIDNFTLLVSLVAIVFVVLRAIKLDQERPWFQVPSSKSSIDPEPDTLPPWRRASSGNR